MITNVLLQLVKMYIMANVPSPITSILTQRSCKNIVSKLENVWLV